MSAVISASQIDTYEDCNRFWWFQRILKLKEPPASHFTFGTVLHAVCERWLSADSTGRVPGRQPKQRDPDYIEVAVVGSGPLVGQKPGNPVDLYPKGWETATERDGSSASVTPTEARLIRKLIEEAIEQGILRRSKQTTVERKILLNIIKGVQLIGYIDVHRNPGMVHELAMIEDHKTYGKNSTRYLKRENSDSPNFLGANQQVKTYAWAVTELDNLADSVGAKVVRVRHNQFPKFPGKAVTAVEATITLDEIRAHGEYLRAVATRMERTRKIKKWEDVPGPKDTGKCSRWYGKPCPHSDICGRTETPEAYKTRLANIENAITQRGNKPRLDLPISTPKSQRQRKAKEATPMTSIFDKAKAQKAARAARAGAAGTSAAVAATPAPAVNGGEAPTAPTPVVGGAPWANPACRGCKGRGLTSKGKACPLCDNTAKKVKKPTSMAYVVEVDDEGQGIAVAREDRVEELENAGMPLEWVEADQEPAQEAAPAPVPQEASVVAPAEEAPQKPSQPAEEPAAPMPAASPAKGGGKRKGGRPGVGLTIMIGCMQSRGVSRPVISSAEALRRFGAELAEAMGAESYYDLDSFLRKDRLAQRADYIASELARHILVHPGVLGNDDEGKLVQALMGLDEGIEAVILRTS